MIDIKDIENIHDILIDEFGGCKGIRDRGALESALIDQIQHLNSKIFIQQLLTRLLQF